jgi:TolB protein
MSLLRRCAPAFLAALVALVALAPTARGQDTTVAGVRIGLVYTPGTRPGVLVLPVAGTAGDSIRAILQRDFTHGDRITVIALEPSAVPPFGEGTVKPNYALFTRLGAAAILQVTPTSFGVQVAVHNAGKGVVERSKAFPLPAGVLSADWRMALHEVSDEIEQWITGVRGIAATRILYVSDGRVWQVDSDGANATAVTAAGSAMSPVWNPAGSHFAYMTMGATGQQIVIREIGGATRILPTRSGLNMTPTFGPDGNTIVYAHGAESGTDLYATNAFGNEPARRITVGRGSDNTQPTFSPDGRRIAFTSGRSGHPEVYISDADGTNAELLTPYNFGDQSYRANPDWSPDGRLIAFEALIGGRMQIMTIGLRDRVIKRHTSEGVNEQPSWAPDARHVVFTSNRGGTKQLWVLDVESNTVRQLTRAPGGARFGAWSPPIRSR